MEKRQNTKQFDFIQLFEKFIVDSVFSKRLQKNGKKIRANSLKNYQHVKSLLVDFTERKKFPLRIRPASNLTKRETAIEKNYWKKFYKKFTDYLYQDKDYYDNTVGSCIKVIRTFFGYLNEEIGINTGSFYKKFYVRKEDIEIIAISPERFNFLIFDKEFETTLEERLKKVKDTFVFGSTVGLRVSDLLKLNSSNLDVQSESVYLKVTSKKTNVFTKIKLPDYAVQIIRKYYKKNKTLLPPLSNVNLNIGIKDLMEKAGWTDELPRFRSKRGIQIQLYKNGKKPFRFCDLITSHTMRRTAISTMLCLGMPDYYVRKISGHSANSKEFSRYVELSQRYIDQETDKVFDTLNMKRMNNSMNFSIEKHA